MPLSNLRVADRTAAEPTETSFRRRRSSGSPNGVRCLSAVAGLRGSPGASVAAVGSLLAGGAAAMASATSASPRRDAARGECRSAATWIPRDAACRSPRLGSPSRRLLEPRGSLVPCVSRASRESAPKTDEEESIREVYRDHAGAFFDELRAWFTKEARALRKEAETQLEADQLRSLRERLEQVEANTVIHMPTSAGDAAAGTGSPRSISPKGHHEAFVGVDAGKMRAICREQAWKAVEELRGELLGGDLALKDEVAELRASIDGAAAAATAAAAAEIGRLDGAFRSSLASEVRDLGSLCEGVRARIEALDQSAAEHVGRLSARLADLEACASEPSLSSGAFPAVACSSGGCRQDKSSEWHQGVAEVGAEGSEGIQPPSLAGDRPSRLSLNGAGLELAAPAAAAERISLGGTAEAKDTCSGGGCQADVLGLPPGEILWVPSPRPLTQALAPPATGATQAASAVPALSSHQMAEVAPACGGGPGQAPSTPPKRHVPPAVAAAMRASPGGNGSSAPPAAGSASFSSRSSLPSSLGSKAKNWMGNAPARHEVRGGC